MKEIKGVIVPILTPMREDGTINSEELVNQIERLIDAGIHGIFVLGTNGEGYILDEDEKTEVIRVAVNTVNPRYGPHVPEGQGTGGGCALHHYAKLCCSLPRRTHPAL